MKTLATQTLLLVAASGYPDDMESLALIVSLMFLAELLLGLVVITFCAIYLAKRKFAATSLVLLGLLLVEGIWAYLQTPGFGYPPLAAFVVAAILRFIPRRAK